MGIPPPARGRRVLPDGVVQLEVPRREGGARLLAGAVAFTLACIGLSAWLARTPGGVEVDATPPSPAVRGEEADTVAPTRPRPSRLAAMPALPVSPSGPEAAPGTAPEEAPLAMADEPSGEPTGIALFPPPGTKPLKRGILVPEDFELPPGYVRHYQATDDGERVPAILMFHPDHQPRDANGEPIPLPEDRIVPPELAPPGLPIRMLKLPGEDGKEPAP